MRSPAHLGMAVGGSGLPPPVAGAWLGACAFEDRPGLPGLEDDWCPRCGVETIISVGASSACLTCGYVGA